MASDREILRDRMWADQVEDWQSYAGVPEDWSVDFARGFEAGSQRAAAMLRDQICGDVHENYDPVHPTDCPHHRSGVG